MSEFRLHSPFEPAGDQPNAIKELTEGILAGDRFQILLGITGSGKTRTVASVIENVQRPTLVMSHNKTLAAQLFRELSDFFPENRVEFFISYYDYYQPEAYISSQDKYIEKDLSINEEIQRLRLRATSSLLSGRRDVIIVSSVSCIYGIGSPSEYEKLIITLKTGMEIPRNTLLYDLVDLHYTRKDHDFHRGVFRVRGDVVDVFPGLSPLRSNRFDSAKSKSLPFESYYFTYFELWLFHSSKYTVKAPEGASSCMKHGMQDL